MNQTYAVRVNAKAIFENGEIADAKFQAVQARNEISLVLDAEPPDRDQYMILFHPLQAELVRGENDGAVAVYEHVGAPIDLTQYLAIPKRRRGFQRVNAAPE
jgi:hypothetical protein